jgi:hypothetical protein
MFVAAAVASASLWVTSEPANAATALFRAKKTWWYSSNYPVTNGHLTPPTALPSAKGHVGTTPFNPSFTVPKSVIKNTTLTFMCPYSGPYPCIAPPGIPVSSNQYSYWNAKGSFRPNNPNAPKTTTTVRVRTVSDGWPGSITYTLPTAMYTRATPTEGGCHVNGKDIITPGDCPGTTQFGGRYTASRGGSIMIWPGGKQFGGTMRFFEGPNASYYRLISFSGPFTSVTSRPAPISQQIGTGIEVEIGEVIRGGGRYRVQQGRVGFHYRLTSPYHTKKLIAGATPNSGTCTTVTAPPNGSGMCAYYRRTANYLSTRAPYTTGRVQVWEPNGNTNTIQSTHGYDNRTPLGLNGTISMVQPRLVHTYFVFPSSSNPVRPILMSWSTARTTKIDFHFAPEPAGVAVLAAGFVTLAGLCRLRR